jgi:hypothetical protein
MGLFDPFHDRQPTAKRIQLSQLCKELSKELATLREEMFVSSCLGLKKKGINIAQDVTHLEKGSRLSYVLQAYQLTCIMEFSRPYLNVEDCGYFDNVLTGYVSDGDPERLARYRERYLDCKGEIGLLSLSLSQDLYYLLHRPTPRETAERSLSANAVNFAIVNQATTAWFFGDVITERKLRSKLRPI